MNAARPMQEVADLWFARTGQRLSRATIATVLQTAHAKVARALTQPPAPLARIPMITLPDPIEITLPAEEATEAREIAEQANNIAVGFEELKTMRCAIEQLDPSTIAVDKLDNVRGMVSKWNDFHLTLTVARAGIDGDIRNFIDRATSPGGWLTQQIAEREAEYGDMLKSFNASFGENFRSHPQYDLMRMQNKSLLQAAARIDPMADYRNRLLQLRSELAGKMLDDRSKFTNYLTAQLVA